MKPFWKKPGKKKVKNKPKSSQKPKQAPQPRPRPEPWKPPERHRDIPKKEPVPSASTKKQSGSYDTKKEFMKTFKQLTYRHRTYDIWSDFVTMTACSISNAVDKSHFDEREKLYMSIIKKYDKKEQALFHELMAHTVMALEEDPEQDFLGKIFMELDLGNEHKGQIFTPYHVCELMAKISMGNIEDQIKEKGYISVNDPCCGAGATLIAAINEAKQQLEKVGLNFQNHILIVGQDIDWTAVMMCYIQTSLLGVAGYFKVGNTFTEPICQNDSLENYWFTPMYFSSVWSLRRLFQKMNAPAKEDGDGMNGRN